MKEIKADANTDYVYVGPNLAKDMEELAKFREAVKQEAAAREARKMRIERDRQERAALRKNASVVEVTPETLAEALDRFTPFVADVQYAEHFVQPYCECEPDEDHGWFACQHARDLGYC